MVTIKKGVAYSFSVAVSAVLWVALAAAPQSLKVPRTWREVGRLQ